MLQHNHAMHLAARYPEVNADKRFAQWMQEKGCGLWHETHRDEKGCFSIIVQSADGNDIFAFNIRGNDITEFETPLISDILETRSLNVTNNEVSATSALEAAGSAFKNNDIISVRPFVDWTKADVSLTWEIDVAKENSVQRFHTESFEKLILISEHHFTRNAAREPVIQLNPGGNDWLEENELHHLNRFRPIAQEWTKGSSTVVDMVKQIFIKTRTKLAYDLTIVGIQDFIWSDNLLVDRTGFRGICDEWAVWQITLLRALGIPAAMKFMRLDYRGKNEGHACVEWSDYGTWRHLDALWGAFDYKKIYRDKGATNITVMDASFPRDKRFFGLSYPGKFRDVENDGKLLTKDYILEPPLPGMPRAGYSF